MIPESSVLLDCHLHGHVDLGGFSCEYEKLFSTPQNSTEPELFTLVQWFSSSSAIPATPILLSRTVIALMAAASSVVEMIVRGENGGRRVTLMTTRPQQGPTTTA